MHRSAAAVVAVMILTFVVLSALPASAEGPAEVCRVGGTSVVCDAPGVTPAHEPYCSSLHYHGVLLGRPDPAPDGCGHGEVQRIFVDVDFDSGFTAEVTLTMGPNPLAVIGLDAFGPPREHRVTPGLVDAASRTAEPQQFRFASDGASAPTIDVPWSRPAGVGSLTIAGNAASGPGGTDLFLIPGNADGVAPAAGETHFVFWSGMEGTVPQEPGGWWVDISFPIVDGQGAGWEPLSQYPADTWQGANLIPQLTKDGPGAAWDLAVTRVEDGELVEVPTSGFAVLHGRAVALFMPASEFSGPPDELRWRVATHVHDGSFGSCSDCLSVVSVFPPLDGGSATPGGSHGFAPFFPADESVIAAVLGETGASASETAATPPAATAVAGASSDVAAGAGNDRSGRGGDAAASSGPRVPLWVYPLVIVLFAGAAWRFRKVRLGAGRAGGLVRIPDRSTPGPDSDEAAPDGSIIDQIDGRADPGEGR